MTVIATCHCGGTKIEFDTAPTHATQCTCTFCSKSGGLWAYYEPEAPRIVSDTHKGMYSASDGINQHFFCANCGCATYGISPAWTLDSEGVPEKKKFALNARLLDDFDLSRLTVEVIDGRNLW
jgi:hypothetical protein